MDSLIGAKKDSIQAINANVLDYLSTGDDMRIDGLLAKELSRFDKKIVVLDDDPTGVQVVHDISIFTKWDMDSLREGFSEPNNIFFVLTNSRGLTFAKTEAVHIQIARNILKVSRETGKDFLIISRSDSTLRGHYPLEPLTLKKTLEEDLASRYDGEVLFFFFPEGGRYTINNIHYVKEGDQLVPAGLTEFAKDKTFPYSASHLGEWCEEKNSGKYKAGDMQYISLESLRKIDIDGITKQLVSLQGYNKVIVNAVSYQDVKVFCIALIRAILAGKRFMFRSAAALTKVLGGVTDQSLLRKKDLIKPGDTNGGILLVGSHVDKTTRQLAAVRGCKKPMEMIEFNQHLVVTEGGLEGEVDRVTRLVERNISNGKTSVIFTRRERFDLPTADKEQQLLISVKISDALANVIGRLKVKPSFIIAKGGITSSDVGTKSLRVRKALVMGQIAPGVPVWMTGPESKFPNMPYVIFPGNVGTETTLKDVIDELTT